MAVRGAGRPGGTHSSVGLRKRGGRAGWKPALPDAMEPAKEALPTLCRPLRTGARVARAPRIDEGRGTGMERDVTCGWRRGVH